MIKAFSRILNLTNDIRLNQNWMKGERYAYCESGCKMVDSAALIDIQLNPMITAR